VAALAACLVLAFPFASATAAAGSLGSLSSAGVIGAAVPPEPELMGSDLEGGGQGGAGCRDNDEPIADAGPDVTGVVGTAVTFDGSGSSDPGGRIIGYHWCFDDGGYVQWQSTPTAQHAFTAAGSYTVRLWVLDDCGAISEADEVSALINNINPCLNNEPPVAVAGADQQGEPGEELSFDGSASHDPDGTLASYAWDFGDGETGSGPQVAHAFAAPGQYTVTLRVTDNCGEADTDTLTVTIEPPPDPCANNQPPSAAAGEDQQGEPGEELSFDGSASSDPDGDLPDDAYQWDFGDGQSGSGVTASHAYAEAGEYEVTLTVTDGCDAGNSDTLLVTVQAPPDPCANNQPPQADGGPDREAETNEQLTFDGGASSDPDGSLASYAWDFGDGQTDSGVQVTHAYSEAGEYEVTLTVTDNCGATAESTLLVDVAEPEVPGCTPAVTAEFQTAPAPCVPAQQVTFVAAACPDLIYSFRWYFPDGSRQYTREAHYTFAQPGQYSVMLRVTGWNGSVASLTKTITVQGEPDLPMAVLSVLEEGVGDAWGLATDGSTVWAAGCQGAAGGVVTADFTDPDAPVELGRFTFQGSPWQMAVSGDLVAVAALNEGVFLFDRSQPQSPTVLGRYRTNLVDGTRAFGVAFGDANTLYVASELSVKVLDVSSPGSPVVLGVLDHVTAAVNNRIQVAGDYLYVGEKTGAAAGNILIYHIGEGHVQAPEYVAAVPVARRPFDLSVRGGLLGVVECNTSDEQGLGTVAFFNVSNPAAPQFLSRLGGATSHYRSILLAASGRAYVTELLMLWEVDLSQPTCPALRDTVNLPGVGAALREDADGYVYAGLRTDVLALVEP